MLRKFLVFNCLVFVLASQLAWAQDDGFQAIVDNRVDKMKRELKLDETQAQAIWPIVKDYVTKRYAVLKEAADNGIVDHIAVKSTLQGLQDQENEQLSKVLTPDQMKEWIDKERMMAALNPDGAESTVDDDSATISPEGASFKF